MIRTALAAALALAALALAPPAGAKAPEAALREIVRNAIDTQILPGHAAFAAEAAALAEAAQDCGAPDPEALRAAYQSAFDAWMAVSHLRFGPSEAEGRALAIAFWPDPKGFGRRALDGLLADEDPVVDDPDAFAEVSIAARGLFALDRLLYDPEAPDVTQGYPCRLVRAVARDLAATAKDLSQAWQAHAEEMGAPGPQGDHRSPDDAARALSTALFSGLEFTADTRIGKPLGELGKPRPRLAEAWRSGRPLRNIRLSVAALRTLASAFAPALTQEEAASMDAGFARAQQVADRAPEPMVEALDDPGSRFAIEAAGAELRRARDKAAEILGPALDLSAGFNSLDGD